MEDTKFTVAWGCQMIWLFYAHVLAYLYNLIVTPCSVSLAIRLLYKGTLHPSPETSKITRVGINAIVPLNIKYFIESL